MDKRSNQRLSTFEVYFRTPSSITTRGATALSETSCSCYCWLWTKSILLLTSYIKWADKQLNCWPLMAFSLGFVGLHKEANILHAALDGVWNCAETLFAVHTLNPIVCVQCSSFLMPNTVGLRVIFLFIFFLSCLAIHNFETLYIPPLPLTLRYKYKPAVRAVPLCYSPSSFFSWAVRAQ